MKSTSTRYRIKAGVAACAVAAAVLAGCGQAAPQTRLTVSNMSAEPQIDEMGEVALAISFDLANDSDQEVPDDLWPRVTLDGTQVPLHAPETEGAGADKVEVTSLAPGEHTTLTATVVPSLDGANEWKLVAAPETRLDGAELIDVVAEAAGELTDVDAHVMVGSSWEECDPDTVHLTITGCVPQATTETFPARLVVRGTIENDTSLTTPATQLPTLVMDGQQVELTPYVEGKPVRAIAGRTEAEGSVADFEATLDFDPTVEHTFEFSARPNTVCEGTELASEIADYLAAFEVS